MEEEVLGKAYDARLMRRLLTYMRPYRRTVVLSLCLLLVDSVLQLLGPFLTKIAIDKYLVPVPNAAPDLLNRYLSANPWTGLAQVSVLFLVALLAALTTDFLQSYYMQWTGQHAMFDLRRELMNSLQKLDIAFYDRNPVGRLVTRVTTDVDVLNDLFASGLVSIMGDIVMLTILLGVMFKLSAGLTLMLLGVSQARSRR